MEGQGIRVGSEEREIPRPPPGDERGDLVRRLADPDPVSEEVPTDEARRLDPGRHQIVLGAIRNAIEHAQVIMDATSS